MFLCGIECKHEVEHHFIDFLWTAVGLVNLVDHNDGLEANLQGLLEHETRLRHRTLKGIDEQQTAVSHIEHTLHLATEIGVSRGIDDIDLCTFPINTYIL